MKMIHINRINILSENSIPIVIIFTPSPAILSTYNIAESKQAARYETQQSVSLNLFLKVYDDAEDRTLDPAVLRNYRTCRHYI